MAQLCPNCGTPRAGSFRYCSSCRHDFEQTSVQAMPAVAPGPRVEVTLSYSERFRGTEWASPAGPISTPARAKIQWRLLLALIGVIVGSSVVGLVASGSGLLDIELSKEVGDLLFLVVIVATGRLSLFVRGQMARGLGKALIVGFVGWLIVAGSAQLLTRYEFPASWGSLRGPVDAFICAFTGATGLRLVLWLFG
jgi:hypothetical protein